MLGFFKKKQKDLPDFWKAYAESFDQVKNQNVDTLRFVVLDTETTGFDYEKDRILCMGALEVYQQSIKVSAGLEVFIRQEIYGKESAKIHGILKEDKNEKMSELEALKLLLNYLENKIIVAHHAIFDLTMINKALARHGLPPLKNKYVDTAFLYKKTLLKSTLLVKKDHYSLDELADKFSISKKDRHTAMGDAYITAMVFLKIGTKLKEKGAISLKDLLR